MRKISYLGFIPLLILLGCGTASNKSKEEASTEPKTAVSQQSAPPPETPAVDETARPEALEASVTKEIIPLERVEEDFEETMTIYPEGSDEPIQIDLSATAHYQVALEMTSIDALKESTLVITGNHWQRAYPIKKSGDPRSDGTLLYSALDQKEDTVERDYGDVYLRIFGMSIRSLPLYRKRLSHKPDFAIAYYKGHWGVRYAVEHSMMLKRMRKYERYPDEQSDIERNHGKTIDQMRAELFAVILSSTAVREALANQGISDLSAEQVERIDQHTKLFAVTR